VRKWANYDLIAPIVDKDAIRVPTATNGGGDGDLTAS
jgi:hypothetical protein